MIQPMLQEQAKPFMVVIRPKDERKDRPRRGQPRAAFYNSGSPYRSLHVSHSERSMSSCACDCDASAVRLGQ